MLGKYQEKKDFYLAGQRREQDKIVEMVKKCIDSFELDLPSYIPICFTGGGLNFIEGITDYLRHEFNRPIELIVPSSLLYSRPDLSSSISLLNMAINIYK